MIDVRAFTTHCAPGWVGRVRGWDASEQVDEHCERAAFNGGFVYAAAEARRASSVTSIVFIAAI